MRIHILRLLHLDILPLHFLQVFFRLQSLYGLLGLVLRRLFHAIHDLFVFATFHMQLVTLHIPTCHDAHVAFEGSCQTAFGIRVVLRWASFGILREKYTNESIKDIYACNILMVVGR